MAATTIKDCLIISCSQRKRDPREFPHVRNEITAAPMAPAWNVYDGNQIRIVRKHYPYRGLDVLILSARFGLLTPRSVIALYNDKLDWARARSPEWVETHVTEAWAWITGGEVGTYRAVYTSLNTVYETALVSGLREFGIKPQRVLCDGPTSRGRRLKALSAFCRERHDPYGIAILDEAQIPVVVARQLALPLAGAQSDQGPKQWAGNGTVCDRRAKSARGNPPGPGLRARAQPQQEDQQMKTKRMPLDRRSGYTRREAA